MYVLDVFRGVFSRFGLRSLSELISFFVFRFIVASPFSSQSIDEQFSYFFPSCSRRKILDTSYQRINVFVFWDTGFDNSPLIVRSCFLSLQKCLDDTKFNLIALDSMTISEYLELPSHIKSLFSKKGLQKSHYADLLRTLLLEKYGGIWVDSTMYFTMDIPLDIAQSPLFFFKSRSDWKPYSSQFIVADNTVMSTRLLLRTICVYFIRCISRSPGTLSYSFYHYLLFVALKRNQITVYPSYSALDTHCLQHACFSSSSFTSLECISLSARSFVHKLTHKKPLLTDDGSSILSILSSISET